MSGACVGNGLMPCNTKRNLNGHAGFSHTGQRYVQAWTGDQVWRGHGLAPGNGRYKTSMEI